MAFLKSIFLLTLLVPQFDQNSWLNEEVKSELETITFESYSNEMYREMNEDEMSFKAFQIALRGYHKLLHQGKLKNKQYLTVIDFTKSANQDRMFVINMDSKTIIHKCLVAHGMKTGGEFAQDFSNEDGSHKSSFGFYQVNETYNGRHDLSIKLDGMEYCNDNARSRGVVIHSAEYVSEEYVGSNGRLGRSYGCPAVSEKNYKEVVKLISGGSCLYIYYPDRHYLRKSRYANADLDYLMANVAE